MGTPPPYPEPPRGIRLEERAPSITTLILDGVKGASPGSSGPVCARDIASAVQVDMPLSRFSGFAADGPNGQARPQSSPFAAAANGNEDACVEMAPPEDNAESHSHMRSSNGTIGHSQHLAHQITDALRPSTPGSPFESVAVGVAPSSPHALECACDLTQQPAGAVARHASENVAMASAINPRRWAHASLPDIWRQAEGCNCAHDSEPILALPLSSPSPVTDADTDAHASGFLTSSAIAAAPDNALLPLQLQQRLQDLLPQVTRSVLPGLLPSLLPAAMAAAMPAASTAAMNGGGNASIPPSVLPAVLEAALPAALAVALPKAISTTLTALLKAPASFAVKGPPTSELSAALAAASMSTIPSLCSDASVIAAAVCAPRPEERQPSLDQQGAAEIQLVRMLFGADSMETPAQPSAAITPAVAAQMKNKPGILEVAAVAAAPASGAGSPTGSVASAAAGGSRAGSPTGSAGTPTASRPASAAQVGAIVDATAAIQGRTELASGQSGNVAAAALSPRRPSFHALPGASGGDPLTTAAAAGNMFSRRLSDTANYGSAAADAAHVAGGAAPKHGHPGHGHHHHGHHGKGTAHSHSSGGSGDGHNPSWAPGDDALSSVDDALSICSGGDAPSPYHELCPAGLQTISSNPNSILLGTGGGSGQDHGSAGQAAAAAASGLYGINRDVLLDRLQQLQLQPQQAAAAVAAAAANHGPSPAELMMAAAASQVPGSQAAAAAAAAALYAQQQQQQQQQQAAAAVAAQQQLQQLQQLQALVSPELAPPSPSLPATAAGGIQWRRTSGTGAFGNTELWQQDADALGFAAASLALGQQQQQQQAVAAGLLQQQQQQQQQQLLAQSLAAVAAANVAGRQLRTEDLIAFGGAATAGLQLPAAAAAAAGMGGSAAAAQFAAAAAAAAAPGGAAAAELAAFMDAALRRMLLVSPQVANELARACGAFSGAQAQLHHLCCVIAEQLLDVAAMAPEVAAALLRALAAHRARGAQATDVDPRVMGRILQLLRAGPAGRQLCLVSLEQWVDGLSRIHKRRAYLDTILHNYQLTLKRLVQAMGHQVHAVNMSLPRQLLNDLSPRALLLLTAELAPYPLLQPRRWSEEIIWTITQMHSMGIDMPTTPACLAAAAGIAAAAGGQIPTTAFQWEIRRALAATAEDIAAAGGPAVACGQSPPGGATACQLAAAGGLAGQPGSGSASGSTTPGGTAVPWAAHAALHRHLLLGLRRVQSRFFSERFRKVHGLYGESVEMLLRQSLPQDVLVPEREVVVLVAVLLMLECRMRPDDFDAAFGRDLQRCLAVSPAEEVAARLRCGLVPDSPLRIDPHKSRALSQLLKLGTLPGQAPF